MNETEKNQAIQLLDELNSISGPAGLVDWNIAAQSFLVFMCAKYPELVTEPIDMEMLWGVPEEELPEPEHKDYFDLQKNTDGMDDHDNSVNRGPVDRRE